MAGGSEWREWHRREQNCETPETWRTVKHLLLGCKAGPIMIKQFQIIEVVPSAACNQRRARTKCPSVLASSTAAADAKAFCSVAASACRKMEQTGQMMLGCIEVIWHVIKVSR